MKRQIDRSRKNQTLGRNETCQKIGRQARGLVDVPKGSRAISSAIGPEESNIAPMRSDVAGGQHVNWAIHRRRGHIWIQSQSVIMSSP